MAEIANNTNGLPDQPLLQMEEHTFRENFNRRPFLIRHNLCDHPLFVLPRLIELSQKLPAEQVEYNAGDLPVAQDPSCTPQTGLSIEETIRRIEECQSWLVMKNVEYDEEYRALRDDCLDSMRPFSEPLAPGMRHREAFIFISSPNSVTPFHVDPEYNFLLQIRGCKQVTMFDAQDRSVVADVDLERYFGGGHRNLIYDESLNERAIVTALRPGFGLHFPVMAPHWVKNGPAVSVSFSITFRNPDSDRREILHRINHRMRKIGLKPSPVGRSPFCDGVKFFAFRSLRAVKSIIRPSQNTT